MRWLVPVVAVGLLAGCQRSPQPPAAATQPVTVRVESDPRAIALESPTTRPMLAGSILLIGDVKSPGQRELRTGQKISDVLKTTEISTPAAKMTLVLNRRSPEGMTREMIDLDPDLRPLDAMRDYLLRDGDELVVSVAPSVPAGLSRPLTAVSPRQ